MVPTPTSRGSGWTTGSPTANWRPPGRRARPPAPRAGKPPSGGGQPAQPAPIGGPARPPRAGGGKRGGRHAEILLSVCDVWCGELTEPFQVPVNRLEHEIAALAL